MSTSRSDSPTPCATIQELSLKSLEDVHEPIDFRLNKASRPSQDQLDETFARKLGDLVHHGQHHPTPEDEEKGIPQADPEPIYVCNNVCLIYAIDFSQMDYRWNSKKATSATQFSTHGR